MNHLILLPKSPSTLGMHEPLDARERGPPLARKKWKLCPTPPAAFPAHVSELRRRRRRLPGDERQFVLRMFGFFRSSSVLRGDIAKAGVSNILGTPVAYEKS